MPVRPNGRGAKAVVSEFENVRNVILGSMFICWAVARLMTAPDSERWSLHILATVGIYMVVGVLFFRRSPCLEEPSLAGQTATLLSLFSGAVMASQIPAWHRWSLLATITFALGTIIALTSMGWLGRSFAIFAARREIRSSGPYRLLRHPIYFGESLMLLGIAIANGSVVSWITWFVCLVLLGWRILAEEKLLCRDPAFVDLQQRVRWRLIPGIW